MPDLIRRGLLGLGSTLLALALTPGTAQAASTWPHARAVRMIVPYPAGGGVDSAARLIAAQLTTQTGQRFVVDNRSGAAGAIGAQAVVGSQADGYTVLFASPAEVLVGGIAGQSLPYHPARDLQPVTLAGESPLAVVVHPDVPARDLQALLTLASQAPEPLPYGTPGAGSTMHFAGAALSLAAGVPMTHVPYRGAAPAIADLLGRQIPMAVVGVAPLMAHHRQGKLRILALTGSERLAALPDVPTVAQALGQADFRYTNWFGVYLPAATAADVTQRLAGEIARAVAQPELASRLAELGVTPIGNTPQAFLAFLQSERARYQAVQRQTGLNMD